jgi:ATP-dependent Clp protease adaptor protein ClpS
MAEKKCLEQKPKFEEILEADVVQDRFLILHNDEVNTFDYVIESLIKVCNMDAIQAEQCTFLVHYKGKCDVKRGDYPSLKPYREALLSKGLQATID